MEIIKVLDDDEIILAQRPFDLSFERAVPIEVMVRGDVISANVAGIDIEAQDPGPRPWNTLLWRFWFFDA
ncbi:hypothetical protein [Martelella mediterranea]|uniref:hypothetical protein n=1 Tax=Martelella mediterranea TaxID=293089 RepID=UPI00104A2393|nr:hypothetical protein [Martelella mediterranea]